MLTLGLVPQLRDALVREMVLLVLHRTVQNVEREKSGDRSQETAFDCGTRSFINMKLEK